MKTASRDIPSSVSHAFNDSRLKQADCGWLMSAGSLCDPLAAAFVAGHLHETGRKRVMGSLTWVVKSGVRIHEER